MDLGVYWYVQSSGPPHPTVPPSACMSMPRFRSRSLLTTYSAFGETTHLAGNLGEANAADSEFAAGFWRLAGDLLQQDQIRLGPLVHLREGGLAGVPAGLFELKGGRVAAGKLVYILASDTEADVSV